MTEELPGGVVGPPEPKSPGEERALQEEKTRGTITRWSLGIFAATVVAGFVGMYTGYWTETKELLQIVLPVESILIGGVAGYYLGTGTAA
jgi:hypothetical protein